MAFNYVLHESHSDGWGTTVLFELQAGAWVFLRSPVDAKDVEKPDTNFPNRDQLAALAKKYLPKNGYNRAIVKPTSTGDFLKVVRWTDANTAVFFAFSSDADSGVLFDLTLDPKKHWKLVKFQILTGKKGEEQLDL